MFAPIRPRPTIPSSMALTLCDHSIAWRAMAPDTSPNSAGPAADVLTIFGITGDLARKMTFRALYRLERREKLDCPIVGVAIDDWSAEQLREHAREAIAETIEDPDEDVFARLAGRL